MGSAVPGPGSAAPARPVAIDGRGTGPGFGLPPGVLYGVPGHGFRREPARIESEPGGLFLPALAQLVAVDVALGRAGHQRRALGEALVVRGGAATALGHRRLDHGTVIVRSGRGMGAGVSIRPGGF